MLAIPAYRPPAAIQFAPQAGFVEARIFFPQIEPAWKAAAFNRLDEIKALNDNWDGYGSPAIPAGLISGMASLINAIRDDDLPRDVPAPMISPASDGIQIEWNGGRGGVEIILHRDGTWASVVELEGSYKDGRLSPSDSFGVVSLLRTAFDDSSAEYRSPSNNFRSLPSAVSPARAVVAA